MNLSEIDASIAYAKAWNQLDAESLTGLLSDNVCYASQWVYEELEGKQSVAGHLTRKINAIKASSLNASRHRPFAELVKTTIGGPERDAIGMTQLENDALDCLVLLETAEGKISRIDICMIELFLPIRSGLYPEISLPGSAPNDIR